MNNVNIYLVDDEPEIADLVEEVLESIGLSCCSYLAANDFFNETRTFAPHALLILDLSMPDMDGIEVMRQLASTPSPPAIILMSGKDKSVLHSAEELCRAHALQLVTTMPKPFHIRQLIEAVNSYTSSIEQHVNAVQQPTSTYNISPAMIEEAISQKQLILHYQPQINISSGRLSGAEALVRWQHPQIGMIYPDSFIHLAEKHGLIDALTRRVIEEAVAQQKKWQLAQLNLPVSVNISADDITSLALPDQLIKMLNDNTLDARNIVLEVTESTLMGELVRSLDILTRLRLKGIHLAIDDFGTGFSSLSQLHKIPFSEMKIDCSFVKAMIDDKDARAIVKTCIILGHELNMRVVAEGVETAEHLALLKEFNCDIAQGYYIAKPMPPEAFDRYLQEKL
ncbi:MAG: diguanylate phosphodiesterase [Alteromonadaceae bacterium]|nr:MAG: diguanylate phosphodiesterase [Alteromonadaceae bacterium]